MGEIILPFCPRSYLNGGSKKYLGIYLTRRKIPDKEKKRRRGGGMGAAYMTSC